MAICGVREKNGQGERSVASATNAMTTHIIQSILIADDNPLVQQLHLAYLSSLGCSADIVSNGLEAVSAVRKRHYDLILMDCDMPGMDGLEATRTIRQLQREDGARPIVIVGVSSAESSRGCLDAGMDYFVSKNQDGQLPRFLEQLLR